ncbi:MAG: redoxin domain-containing protein [Chloroflexi bacterium]|nr:redoxin domain-containing protein [Chloroflexota bacterium]
MSNCYRRVYLPRLLAVAIFLAMAVFAVIMVAGCRSGVKGSEAPELEGATGWVNAKPFTLASLRGKVVLIDFWTYTCVNCIRTFPYLREWHEKYADRGLVIVGVHSPEFEFEKKTSNVVKAAETYGLRYRIVQDNDFKVWNAYDNNYWPAKYLIDKDGVIRYTHFGEGDYAETEAKIRELLTEAGFQVGGVEAGTDAGPKQALGASRDPETRQTRELYGGYLRGNSLGGLYVANREYYDAQDKAVAYTDPGNHRNHLIYLQGPWINGPESLDHGRATQNYEDYLAIRFSGASANAVIDFSEGTKPFRVVVTLDGGALPRSHFGADIRVDEDGKTFFLVDEPRMYRVVESQEFDSHELALSSNSADFALFAFTFGSYEQGP